MFIINDIRQVAQLQHKLDQIAAARANSARPTTNSAKPPKNSDRPRANSERHRTNLAQSPTNSDLMAATRPRANSERPPTNSRANSHPASPPPFSPRFSHDKTRKKKQTDTLSRVREALTFGGKGGGGGGGEGNGVKQRKREVGVKGGGGGEEKMERRENARLKKELNDEFVKDETWKKKEAAVNARLLDEQARERALDRYVECVL